MEVIPTFDRVGCNEYYTTDLSIDVLCVYVEEDSGGDPTYEGGGYVKNCRKKFVSRKEMSSRRTILGGNFIFEGGGYVKDHLNEIPTSTKVGSCRTTYERIRPMLDTGTLRTTPDGIQPTIVKDTLRTTLEVFPPKSVLST